MCLMQNSAVPPLNISRPRVTIKCARTTCKRKRQKVYGATRVPVIMALKTVKCSNCNIVISEVLAFVQNKADVMDEESIVRLCNTAFKHEEIVTAKNLLFDSVQTGGRKVNRKGEGKEKRDMEDIICVIKETDPECLPVFVARDLQRLPPVTFDHLDATRILKDIIILQRDITVIKENYVTKEMLKISSPEVNEFVNNRRRGAGFMDSFDCENAPIGIPHNSPNGFVKITDSTNDNLRVLRHENKSAVSCERTPKHHITTSLAQSLSKTRAPGETGLVELSQERAEANNKSSYAETAAIAAGMTHDKREREVMSHKLMSYSNDPNNEWTLVQRKRNKNKFIGKKGAADVTTGCKFKAANINIPFYIYNVCKDCPSTEITEYIKHKTGIEVKLEKINMKLKKDYEAYKFMIPKDTLSVFLDENLWPSGISFRRYVTFNKKWNNGDNRISSAINIEQK